MVYPYQSGNQYGTTSWDDPRDAEIARLQQIIDGLMADVMILRDQQMRDADTIEHQCREIEKLRAALEQIIRETYSPQGAR